MPETTTTPRRDRYEAPEFPPNPPPGSVLLDRHGAAWQRSRGGRYWLAVGGQRERPWVQLLMYDGPVTVVYVPEVSDAG